MTIEIDNSARRPVIVATHRIFSETRRMLADAGVLVAPSESEEALPVDVLRRAAGDATALLAFMPDRVDDAFLAASPKLRIVAGALKGYDNFDAEACARRGVWLTIVPDLLTIPAAELTIGLMIGLARHVAAGDAYIRGGQYRGWRPAFYGRGLAGETAGFVGFGAIGRAIAERLQPFRMTLLYADPMALDAQTEHAFGITRLPLDDLLARADYIIAAAPLTTATLHLLGDATLSRVKQGALLINVARGSVFDEAAVARALRDGRLGGYAADVFEMEDWQRDDRPRAIAAELLAHPNTVLTPHLGSAIVAARQAIERRAVENILDALSGRVPRDAICGPGRRAGAP